MRPSTLTHRELISRLQQSYDPNLLGELLQRYRPQVIKQCYRYTHDWEMSQDLSQEVFLCAFTKFQSFRGQASFATWLYIIAYHRSVDFLRQKKVNCSFQEDVYWPTESGNDTETYHSKKLWVLLDKISTDERRLLLMKYQDHRSIREIHQIMGLSESTIKTRLCRTRKKLRKLLQVISASPVV